MSLMLTTERLLLRDFVLDDWPAVHAYASQPEVYRFQPWEPSTPEAAFKYVATTIAQARIQPRIEYALAIILKSANAVIGTCNLVVQNQQFRHGELGYFLHTDYWGQGYATEAAQHLLHFSFTKLGLHRITGTCDPRNTASVRVLAKVGMQYEGRLREHMLLRDGWRDSLLFSLLDHEWTMLHQ